MFEMYNNYLIPHGCHIHNTFTDVFMATMCPSPSTYYGLPLFRSCDKCPNIVIPIQEANKYTATTYPTIIFHVYRNLSCCIVYGINPYKEQTMCYMCSTLPSTDMTE